MGGYFMFDLVMNKIRPFFKWVSAIGLFCMIPLTTIDVVRRAITGHGMSGTTQTVEMLMLVTVFFALGEAQKNNQHIDIGFLVDHLDPKIRIIINIIVNCICIGLGFIFSIYGFGRAINSLGSGETMWLGLTCIVMWPFRLIVAIGFLYWLLCIIQDLIINIKKHGISFKPKRL